jgi:hypothetical protein
MTIISIKSQKNGAHSSQSWGFKPIPEGYAQIPDDMVIPDTFPFVNIEVAEETRYKEIQKIKDVVKTVEIPVYDEEGNVISTKTKEYTVKEAYTEQIPYTVMVVTSMTEGVVPERPPEPIPEPTTDEILDVLLGVADDE